MQLKRSSLSSCPLRQNDFNFLRFDGRSEAAMKLSTKGRYGLRALLDLAVNSEGSHVSLYNIADRQKISVNYLEQVFSTLRKSGIVRSIKGAQGGYMLDVNPANIKVGDILRNLEGSLSVVDDGPEENIGSMERCICTKVWNRLNESINNVIDSITLQDLITEYRHSANYMMYYI
jgi:Rrf2 family cysteine metabolism transcriptional repressor